MGVDLRGVVAAARRHPGAAGAARFGYAASGVLHLLIALVALRLAWRGPGALGSAVPNQVGALRQLAGHPLGGLALWALAAGLAVLAIWQLGDTVVLTERTTRLRSLGRAVVYGVLAASAAGVADGPGDDEPTEEDLTAALLQHPAGRWLLIALALAVVGTGVYHLLKGWRSAFIADLRAQPGPWVERAARVGYVSKGVALVVVGALLAGATSAGGGRRGQGLDAALLMLLEVPLGAPLVAVVGLGFGAYGAYALARARRGWC